jgi:hypothetical protein
MTDEHDSFTAPAEVGASAQTQLDAPPWFCRAAVMLQYLLQCGLGLPLLASFVVPRGRASDYDTGDFVLQLLAFACSNEPNIKAFYKASSPIRDALVALWSRRKQPSRSALGRFLRAVSGSALKPLQRFLLDDLLAHGVPPTDGLSTRTGTSYLVFDGDGTREAIRRRSVRGGEDHPPALRRAINSFAPGFLGRKRGEEVRSRFVLMQAHTQEWLGGWLTPGNGARLEALDAALDSIKAYMSAHQRPVGQAILRLDGGHGWFADIQCIRATGAHVLTRCVDYRLLESSVLTAQLQRPSDGGFHTPDSPCQREWWDAGLIDWKPKKTSSDPPVPMRLVVTRRTLAPNENVDVSVGIRRGNFVWELFATSVPSDELTGSDILSLYAGRGGFEGILAQEDREMNLDKLVSGHLDGQSAWQILGMFVWNIHSRLGRLSAAPEATARTTVWAEAIVVAESEAAGAGAEPSTIPPAVEAAEVVEPENPLVPVEPPPTDAGPEGLVAPVKPPSDAETEAGPRTERAALRSRTRLEREGFSVDEEGQLRCPAGQRMRGRETRPHGRPSLHKFEMSVATCRPCVQRETCAKSPCLNGHGRRVYLPMLPAQLRALASPQPPVAPAVAPATPEGVALRSATPALVARAPRPGPRPVLWHDLAGSALRAEVGRKLYQQHVEVAWGLGSPEVEEPRLATRATRAHARKTWAERRQKNARRRSDPRLKIRLYGLPTALHAVVTGQDG